jgi:hypothetical protein
MSAGARGAATTAALGAAATGAAAAEVAAEAPQIGIGTGTAEGAAAADTPVAAAGIGTGTESGTGTEIGTGSMTGGTMTAGEGARSVTSVHHMPLLCTSTFYLTAKLPGRNNSSLTIQSRC